VGENIDVKTSAECDGAETMDSRNAAGSKTEDFANFCVDLPLGRSGLPFLETTAKVFSVWSPVVVELEASARAAKNGSLDNFR